MSDHFKNSAGTIASAAGFIGSVTLGEVNTVVSIVCGVAGTVAACLTIWNALHKRKKR